MRLTNSIALLLALIVERLAFYLIIPRTRTLISGLLYVLLGIRIARIYPHIGTSLFAGGGLMAAFFVPIFPVIGLILASIALILLSFRLLRVLDAAIFSIFKVLGRGFFRAYIGAIIRIAINREAFDSLEPVKYRERLSARRFSRIFSDSYSLNYGRDNIRFCATGNRLYKLKLGSGPC